MTTEEGSAHVVHFFRENFVFVRDARKNWHGWKVTLIYTDNVENCFMIFAGPVHHGIT